MGIFGKDKANSKLDGQVTSQVQPYLDQVLVTARGIACTYTIHLRKTFSVVRTPEGSESLQSAVLAEGLTYSEAMDYVRDAVSHEVDQRLGDGVEA